VDPAVSLGHGEVDLAMMELFGGFHRETFEAYFDARPSPPGYAEVRRPLYQLYYLLVHIRLFGGGYAHQTRAAAREVLQVLGR
jgi:fructosamine-3-kinase